MRETPQSRPRGSRRRRRRRRTDRPARGSRAPRVRSRLNHGLERALLLAPALRPAVTRQPAQPRAEMEIRELEKLHRGQDRSLARVRGSHCLAAWALRAGRQGLLILQAPASAAAEYRPERSRSTPGSDAARGRPIERLARGVRQTYDRSMTHTPAVLPPAPVAEIQRRLAWPALPVLAFLGILIGLGVVALMSQVTRPRLESGLPDDPDLSAAALLVRDRTLPETGALRWSSALLGEGGTTGVFAPLERQRARRADDYVARALKRHMWDPRAWASQGALALVEGDYPRAERAYRRALDRNPHYGEARLGLGVTLALRARHEPGPFRPRALTLAAIAQLAAVPADDAVLPAGAMESRDAAAGRRPPRGGAPRRVRLPVAGFEQPVGAEPAERGPRDSGAEVISGSPCAGTWKTPSRTYKAACIDGRSRARFRVSKRAIRWRSTWTRWHARCSPTFVWCLCSGFVPFAGPIRRHQAARAGGSMDTGSGNSVSVWVGDEPLQRREPLAKDLEADVCVVGAGIAGLSSRYALARAGRSVVVARRRRRSAAARRRAPRRTSSNALDDRYYAPRAPARRGGRAARRREPHARRSTRSSASCAEERSTATSSALDGYLFVPPGRAPTSSSSASSRPRHRAGLAGRRAGSRARRSAASTPGRCLRFPRQAQFHPLQYLAGLARAIERARRADLHGDARDEHRGRRRPARVATAGGPS